MLIRGLGNRSQPHVFSKENLVCLKAIELEEDVDILAGGSQIPILHFGTPSQSAQEVGTKHFIFEARDSQEMLDILALFGYNLKKPGSLNRDNRVFEIEVDFGRVT